MPANEKANPIEINFFSAEAIVHVPHAFPDLVKQPDGLQGWGAGFQGVIYNWIKAQYRRPERSGQGAGSKFVLPR